VADLSVQASETFGLGENPVTLRRDSLQVASSPSGLAPSIVVETTSLLEVPKAIGLGVRCTSVGDKLIDHGAETVAKHVQNSHPGAQKNIPCVFKWTARSSAAVFKRGHSNSTGFRRPRAQSFHSGTRTVVLKRPSEVYLTGSFNDWQLIPMTLASSAFVTILELPVGEHHYKFVVDGRWICDPTQTTLHPCDEAAAIQDGGEVVNVLNVSNSDRDPFEALDVDIDSQRRRDESGGLGSAKSSYGQEMPAMNSKKIKPPPVLPPHLLQVILNKDTPLVCEPTLLPTPNHVMVNHVYALSIKDNVIVMSSTSRFKKKYVTTVLYKPI